MVTSPKTYNIIRKNNVLQLPSTRTLKDYTHWSSPKVGYRSKTFVQLFQDYKLKELLDFQKSVINVICVKSHVHQCYTYRHVVLAFDEMRIHEGLVFNAKTGTVIGFVDTGEMNTKLKEFEAHVNGVEEPQTETTTHMLAVCIRGIFMKLDYPAGHFPTASKSIVSSCC